MVTKSSAVHICLWAGASLLMVYANEDKYLGLCGAVFGDTATRGGLDRPPSSSAGTSMHTGCAFSAPQKLRGT